mgnify:CR=1 FL=1
MAHITDVLKKPVLTEKSLILLQEENKYTFDVDVNANKIEIKKAVEEIFKVKVVSVNTINVLPKRKRVGQHVGYAPAYKKAICKLAEGDKIAEFDI